MTLQEFAYRFVKTTEQFFFGYEEHTLDGEMAQIATVEKALIDMIQFHRSDYSTDRVLELLTDQGDAVDLMRLTNYLLRSGLTTQRIFGLIFDRLQFDYDRKLEASARSRSADSRLSASAQKGFLHIPPKRHSPAFWLNTCQSSDEHSDRSRTIALLDWDIGQPSSVGRHVCRLGFYPI